MRQICLLLLSLAALLPLHAQQTDDLIHTVAAGETLITIASSYGVTLDDILRLNNLDPDAYLQIGQRLLVVPDARRDQAENEDAADDSSVAELAAAQSESQLEAPVIEASAPMMDPAELGPRLCFMLYDDANHNGMRELDEPGLAQGKLTLFDSSDIERLHYTTDGESEPYCLSDLGRQVFRLETLTPPGYGLIGASSLWLDLRQGGTVTLELGARAGLDSAISAAITPEPIDEVALDDSAGLLRELSGIALMAVAAVVMASGLLVALFLRGR